MKNDFKNFLMDNQVSRYGGASLWLPVRALVGFAVEREKFFREKAETCYKKMDSAGNAIDTRIWGDLEEYFDGVADAWKEIAEGKCKQLETRLKQVVKND